MLHSVQKIVAPYYYGQGILSYRELQATNEYLLD